MRMSQRVWAKYLAGFLLLWALVDLTVPMVCQTDVVEFPAVQTAAGTALQKPQDGNSPQQYYEDDCFCCCSHIIPAPHVVLTAALVSVPADFPAEPGKIDGIAQAHYHPPRS